MDKAEKLTVKILKWVEWVGVFTSLLLQFVVLVSILLLVLGGVIMVIGANYLAALIMFAGSVLVAVLLYILEGVYSSEIDKEKKGRGG